MKGRNLRRLRIGLRTIEWMIILIVGSILLVWLVDFICTTKAGTILLILITVGVLGWIANIVARSFEKN